MDSDDLGTPLGERTAVFDREQLLKRQSDAWLKEIERANLPIFARHELYAWLDGHLPGWDDPPSAFEGKAGSADELAQKLIAAGKNSPRLLFEIQLFHAGLLDDVERTIRSVARRESHSEGMRRVICLVLFVRRHTPLHPR